jgi:hypothetical protein
VLAKFTAWSVSAVNARKPDVASLTPVRSMNPV